MTNDTGEHDGLCKGDTEASEATTDRETRRGEDSERSARAAVGTATEMQATADLSAARRTKNDHHTARDTAGTDGDTTDTAGDETDAVRDVKELAGRGEEAGTGETRQPSHDDSRRLGSDPGDAPNIDLDSTPGVDPTTDPTDGRIDERLRAVERAITGTDDAVADLGDEATATAERDALATRLDELEARVAELEAATQAIRGYVGSIRSVNQAVERRADLALAEARKSRDNAAGGGASPGVEAGAADEQISDTETDCDDTRFRTTGRKGDTNDTAVPGEDALDAALPEERSGATDTEAPAAATADRVDEAGEGTTESSWRPAALERLRESI